MLSLKTFPWKNNFILEIHTNKGWSGLRGDLFESDTNQIKGGKGDNDCLLS